MDEVEFLQRLAGVAGVGVQLLRELLAWQDHRDHNRVEAGELKQVTERDPLGQPRLITPRSRIGPAPQRGGRVPIRAAPALRRP